MKPGRSENEKIDQGSRIQDKGFVLPSSGQGCWKKDNFPGALCGSRYDRGSGSLTCHCLLSQLFSVHPTHPQARLLAQAADILTRGGLVALPTDTTYALVCHLGDRTACDKLRRLRRLSEQHYLTLLCADLSVLGQYAKVDNGSFRLLKHYTPGPYTFILPATRDVPRRLVHAKRKTLGLRVPDHVLVQALLQQMGEPLLSSTLRLPDDDLPLTDADEIRSRLQKQVDLVIESGSVGVQATTVVDLTGPLPEVLRQGVGDFA